MAEQKNVFLSTADNHTQTSTISSYVFTSVNGHSQYSLEILAQILASLTLPALREIGFCWVYYPRGSLEWPHAQFLALSKRSGFAHTLKSLNVAHVRIAEPALLEVLSMLTSLEELQIADKWKVHSEGADVVLITDSLLRAIPCATSGADAADSDTTWLIPQLRVLRC